MTIGLQRVLCVVCAVSCSGGSPPTPQPTGTPGPAPCTDEATELEIGEGLDGYVPIEAGGPLQLVYGPQGGYHLEIGLSARGLDTSELALGSLTGSIDGVVLATSAPRLDFRCNPATDALESWGTLLVYDAEPSALAGATTEIVASVQDASGLRLEAIQSFTIFDERQ